jgi:GTP-binding protein
MSKKIFPQVVLVGRTNVGKSTLFNRIAKRTESMVADQSGVTRDYVSEILSIHGKNFELVDTGGLAPAGTEDPLYNDIEAVSQEACQTADVIIFVCDGRNGLTLEDKQVAKQLHKLKKNTVLVLNKADNIKTFQANESEFYALGFSTYFAVSAVHGTGINELLTAIANVLPATTARLPEAPSCKIALLGKPNVGKSSLMNALVSYKRSIVSDIAGTTREAISERITFCGQDLLLTDTAGVRRKRKVTDDLETLMVKSSLAAVRTADIIVLLVDANEGRLSDQELKLMFYAFEEHKALLLVFNKSDLMTQEKLNLLEFETDEYSYFLKNIPQVHTSCLTGKNVGIVMREIDKIRTRLAQPINSAELTVDIHEYFRQKPLFHNSMKLQVFSLQKRNEKGLSFTLCVNEPKWFGQSQLQCIENFLRKKYDIVGCPVHFVIIKRGG